MNTTGCELIRVYAYINISTYEYENLSGTTKHVLKGIPTQRSEARAKFVKSVVNCLNKQDLYIEYTRTRNGENREYDTHSQH